MHRIGWRFKLSKLSLARGKLKVLNSGIVLIKAILSLKIFLSDELLIKSKSAFERVSRIQSVNAIALKKRFFSEPPSINDSPKTIPYFKVPKCLSNAL
jgi:hypothetical protein